MDFGAVIYFINRGRESDTIRGSREHHVISNPGQLWNNILSSLSKKTPSSKVGDELRTNLLNVHMTIT